MTASTQLERIATLEEQVDTIKNKLDSIDNKLGEIVALRNKGVGAFWLASALLGTGIMSFLHVFFDWLRGI